MSFGLHKKLTESKIDGKLLIVNEGDSFEVSQGFFGDSMRFFQGYLVCTKSLHKVLPFGYLGVTLGLPWGYFEVTLKVILGL